MTVMITDADGKPIQHLSYLPFGEEFVDQQISDWSAAYKFSGKEKDAETSYNYFGARYYWSDGGIWLSVDPLSDRYPSHSSYCYTLNNPIKLVDPDGREVIDPGLNPIQEARLSQVATGMKGSENKGKKPPTATPNPTSSSSPPTISSSQTSSSQSNNNGVGWGVSLDINLSAGAVGYSVEVGYVKDASGNGSLFYSHGTSAGFEASVGANGFVIPSSDFRISDFEGKSMSSSVSTPWVVSFGVMTDHSAGAEKDYYFNNYGGGKIGAGLGAGASISHTKTTLFQMPKRDNTNVPVYYQRGHK